jgi:hypothetical protein
MKWKLIPTVLVILFFAFFSIRTLPDYGVNWDTFQHLARGQIYLRYLTQGKTDQLKPKSEQQISYYQITPLTFDWAQQMTIGHPPLSDILMAGINRVVWGKFGLVGDIESYHLYVVLMTILTMSLLGIWSYIAFGPIASAFTVLAFGTLPHLFAEQHFNIKDPLVLAYYTGALFFLWLAIEYKKIWPIIVSALFFGLSLGTKFNIIFSIFPIGVWLVSLKFWENKKLTKIVIVSLVLIPIIAYGMFLYSYPALWSSPIQKAVDVVRYYQSISKPLVACTYYPLTIYWFEQCSDWKTPLLFMTTTPLITLLLFVFGLMFGLKHIAKKNNLTYLWITWLLITLGRATLPVTSLYGGSLRQIMEYMAPLSLLSGVGAIFIFNWIVQARTKYIFVIIVCVSYIIVIFQIIKIHPNENVYFNELIGGLRGAVRNGVEGANNTYGNAYKQGIRWLNTNADYGATISLGMGIRSAIPDGYIRTDIRYVGDQSIISAQKGEYIMELAYPGMNVNDYFRMRYALRFLNPVHVVSVDGIPLLYIWKNDKQHTMVNQQIEDEMQKNDYQQETTNDAVRFSFINTIPIKRIEFFYTNTSCVNLIQNTFLSISNDRGKTWFNSWGVVGDFNFEIPFHPGVNNVYLFTGEKITDLNLYYPRSENCSWSDIMFKIIRYQ